MKYEILFILLIFFVGCRSDQGKSAYEAALKNRDTVYFSNDINRAYQGEVQFIEFIKQSKRDGAYLPNPDMLVWEYSRLALLADYCGRKDEASRLFTIAEKYAKASYPNEPADKTSAVALRSAIEEIVHAERVPWGKVIEKNHK